MYEVISFTAGEGLDELTDKATMREALQYIRRHQECDRASGLLMADGYGVWNYRKKRITKTVGYFPFQADESGVLRRW